MNNGLPNISKVVAGIAIANLKLAPGGVWAGLVEKIFTLILTDSSKKLLVLADTAHVAIIVKRDGGDFVEGVDTAYETIEEMGGHDKLTQEEKDAIDQPVMDALLKLKFRVRKSKNS